MKGAKKQDNINENDELIERLELKELYRSFNIWTSQSCKAKRETSISTSTRELSNPESPDGSTILPIATQITNKDA